MNSVSPIVSQDAARRRRRCKRINATDPVAPRSTAVDAAKSDRLLPNTTYNPMVVADRSGSNENRNLPLFVIYR
jgi:hypothetical protein